MTALTGARARRLPRALAAGAAVTVALTGCQGAYDLPLPGGAARGDDVYRVTVEFADVLDLVPQSSVKVDDVPVGAVESVSLDGWTARVRIRLEDHVRLPDNATAELKQTSLLGEKFVSLSAPEENASGRLSDGDLIPLERSGRNPEVEEVLGALSLLLNGGGVAQLKVIETELNKAMTGNEQSIRSLLSQLDTFVGGLEEQKSEIVRAIESIDRLSARIAAQRKDVDTALTQIPPGLKVLADQRTQLTAMLTSLDRLGAVGTRVIRASKDDTVANLESLEPVLAQLSAAGDSLPNSLELLLTYPFPDDILQSVRGDYTNLEVTADLDLRSLLANNAPGGGPGPLPLPRPPGGIPTTPPGLPGAPSVPGVPSVPGAPGPLSGSSSTPTSGGLADLLLGGAR